MNIKAWTITLNEFLFSKPLPIRKRKNQKLFYKNAKDQKIPNRIIKLKLQTSIITFTSPQLLNSMLIKLPY